MNTTKGFLPELKIFHRSICILFLGIALSNGALSQSDSLACNTRLALIADDFNVSVDHGSPGQTCWEGDNQCPGENVPANVIDNDSTNYSTGIIEGTGELRLSVVDDSVEYGIGFFAGFAVSSDLLSDGEFGSITIKTYLNNVPQETRTATDLVGFSAEFLTDVMEVGFITTEPFDEIEININDDLGEGTYNVYYAVIENYCEGSPLECNEMTQMSQPEFPMSIDYENTGSDGLEIGNVDDPEAVISNNPNDYASLNLISGALGSAFIAIEEQVTNYPAGTFVAFDIQNTTMPGIGLLEHITITSYLDGEIQEIKTGADLFLGASVDTESGRQTVGFVTDTEVDGIKLTLSQSLDVTLGTTNVYCAIFLELCEGEDLPCNELRNVSNPEYSVLIDASNTGIAGGICLSCNVLNAGAILDDDEDTYAEIQLTAGAAVTGSLAVVDPVLDYPANTFAGFHIENSLLVDSNLLSGITVSTYLDGVFQEEATSLTGLVAIGSNEMENTGEFNVGLITSMPFDEVKISLENELLFDIGTTRIHGLVLEAFCSTEIACDSTYYLNAPGAPVYLDYALTGILDTCVDCAIVDPADITSESNTDFARIEVTEDAEGSVSLAVADALFTYPEGTLAGFVVKAVGNVSDEELLGSITISTYLDGQLQESEDSLIDMAAFVDAEFVNFQGAVYAGFEASMPFDEARITINALVDDNIKVNVYAAFANTENAVGDELECPDSPDAVNDNVETDEDVSITIDVLANDSDPDSPLGMPSVIEGGPAFGDAVLNHGDSTITYSPDLNFVGIDSFRYELCDQGTSGLCDTATVTITVNPVTDTIFITIPEDSLSTFCADSLTKFSEPAISIEVCAAPSNGETMVSATCLTYTPYADWSGLDSFCVLGCDENVCDTTMVMLEVMCPRVSIEVFLEGPYDSASAQMSTFLNEYHVLPGQNPDSSIHFGAQILGVAAPEGQPYDTLPWNWEGTEGDAYGDEPGDIQYDESVTDWVLISVREGDSLSASEVWKCAGLLYNDGRVIFPEQCECAHQLQNGNTYYIVVEHRNHLPVMSPKQTMTGNVLDFDFTENQSWIYSLSGIMLGSGQKLIGETYVMYAGNSEQTSARGDINSSDDSQWIEDNGSIFTYVPGDHNLDGDTNSTDEFIWIINNSTFTLLPF